jgi:hypothetical protein
MHREEPRHRGRDAAIEEAQRVERDQRERPQTEAVEAQPVQQQRRQPEHDEHRRELRQAVEPDANGQLRRLPHGAWFAGRPSSRA